jgi:hypothetical protein
LTKNPMQHARTKHIDMQHHFVREWVENREVTFEYLLDGGHGGECVIKALSKERHNKLITMFKLETS